ncbi:MAG: GNAT family N-acetyltransferase [Flavobacteriaceae bacterium]|nr:GNAT family N-acetyltransferase [Flavobacteriaceae bacterium]
MTNYIINNLFEFWEYISSQSNFFEDKGDYKYSYPSDKSWPSKVFGIDSRTLDFDDLSSNMKKDDLPNSLGILEDEYTEKQLISHNFIETSVVKGMYLNIKDMHQPMFNTGDIQQVVTKSQALGFAKIASECFGYDVNYNTILSLLGNDNKIKLYIDNYNGNMASCGIVFVDKYNISGIHMIGTIPKYRGLGLGKAMTTRLISEACKSSSNKVVLVASKSGERIYSKMGFRADKLLKSYLAG